MRIALYGPYMFELAAGLRENPENDVRLFLDEATMPRSLLSESALQDPRFVEVGPWLSRRAILRPSSSEIARRLARPAALVPRAAAGSKGFAPAAGPPYRFSKFQGLSKSHFH